MKKRRQSYEEEISEDYEKGHFKSVGPSKAELKSFREAAPGYVHQEPEGKCSIVLT
jgi:hypothetical protein